MDCRTVEGKLVLKKSILEKHNVPINILGSSGDMNIKNKVGDIK